MIRSKKRGNDSKCARDRANVAESTSTATDAAKYVDGDNVHTKRGLEARGRRKGSRALPSSQGFDESCKHRHTWGPGSSQHKGIPLSGLGRRSVPSLSPALLEGAKVRGLKWMPTHPRALALAQAALAPLSSRSVRALASHPEACMRPRLFHRQLLRSRAWRIDAPPAALSPTPPFPPPSLPSRSRIARRLCIGAIAGGRRHMCPTATRPGARGAGEAPRGRATGSRGSPLARPPLFSTPCPPPIRPRPSRCSRKPRPCPFSGVTPTGGRPRSAAAMSAPSSIQAPPWGAAAGGCGGG